MKKEVLITIIGIIIIGIAYLGIEMFDFAKGVKEDAKKNKIELKQNPFVKLTEFKNGRWISTTDSLAGIGLCFTRELKLTLPIFTISKYEENT